MFAEYERGPENRFLVAEQCCQDCMSVLNLLDKLNALPTLLEMAKVARAIPEDLVHGGQHISVYTHLLAAAHEIDDYVVEYSPQHAASADQDCEKEQENYKSAHVEESRQGCYPDPIITVLMLPACTRD